MWFIVADRSYVVYFLYIVLCLYPVSDISWVLKQSVGVKQGETALTWDAPVFMIDSNWTATPSVDRQWSVWRVKHFKDKPEITMKENVYQTTEKKYLCLQQDFQQ